MFKMLLLSAMLSTTALASPTLYKQDVIILTGDGKLHGATFTDTRPIPQFYLCLKVGENNTFKCMMKSEDGYAVWMNIEEELPI